MSISVIPLTDPAQQEAMLDLLGEVFGGDFPSDERQIELALLHPSSTYGAYDGDTLVACAGAYRFEMTVPGARVTTEGVTGVGVRATHRRRGLLTAMMTEQLHAVHGTVPVAALWASESPIYGRFGYGLAARSLALNADSMPVAGGPHEPVRTIDPHAVVADLNRVYETNDRPGFWARTGRWWDNVLLDNERRRGGASPLRCVVHDGPDGIDGYALFRVKAQWDDGGVPNGIVKVQQVHGSDARSYAALLAYLFSIDLTRHVEIPNRPIDDPLLHLVSDLRRTRAQLRDSLYIRLVDVDSALEARTYAAALDVVIDVRDRLCPWNAGKWRLSADTVGAKCHQTKDAADIGIDVMDLGAVYLGGTRLTSLSAAGRVTEHRRGAVNALSLAFSHDVEPWSPIVF